MSKSKEDLPENWFKRYSRKRNKGREYYYNKKTKQRTWDNPLKNITEESVVQWLTKNEFERDSFVPVETIDLTQCVDLCINSSTENSLKLEEEYKKFEIFLAGIEGGLVTDSINPATYPVDQLTQKNKRLLNSKDVEHQLSSINLKNLKCYAQLSMDELKHEKTSNEKPRIRPTEQPINQTNGNIYQEQMTSTSFYLVIGTDIFLKQLAFVANLLNKIVPGKPMLVIPYVVLQELDNLKMRTESTTSLLALDAIAFICSHLKMMPNKIWGQSVMDNECKFIQIHNANDSIINCCLQLKQHSENVVLLTIDKSLMSKCICSHIDAYFKNDFEATFLNCKPF